VSDDPRRPYDPDPNAELVPGERPSHHGPDDERTHRSVPLETDEGTRVIEQESTGRENVEGGGEWPQPAREPEAPAPGAASSDD
jgi:hypothetical protein